MTERKKRTKDTSSRRGKAVFRLYRSTEKAHESAVALRYINPTPETYATVAKIEAARDLVQYVKHNEGLAVPATWQEFFNGDETKPEYPYTLITRLSQDTIDDDHLARKTQSRERAARKVAEGLALIGLTPPPKY